jgi:hypothetical protein
VVGGGGDPLGTGFNGDFSMDFANIVKGCNPIHGGVDYLNTKCFTLPYAPTAFAATNCPPNFPGSPGPPPIPPSGFYNTTLTAPTGMTFCQNLVGNAGRNSLYGPGLATVDFSVFKNFRVTKISEAFNVQFRAEFFNILNHTNFQAPNFLTDGNNNSIFNGDGSLLSTTAGVLGSTTTSSRQIQLGLKLIW